MATLFTDTTTVKSNQSGTGRYARELATSLTRHHLIKTPDKSWNPHHSDSSVFTGNYHKFLNLTLFANRLNVSADASFFPNYFIPPSWPYPSAVTIHDVSFLTHPQYYSRKMTTYYRMRIGHSIKRAELILTVSEVSKQAISTHLNVDKKRIIVHQPAPPLPEAATLSKRLQYPKNNGSYDGSQPYLLYVGNIEPKKNTARMVQAFADIEEKNGYRLLLIGKLSGPKKWRQQMQRMIQNSAGVEWKGYLSDQELMAYLDHASCLVLVSHVEGFGLPVMDALARDIPVLISRDPALNEVSEGAAMRVDENQTAAISRAMEQVIHSEVALPNTSERIHERFGKDVYEAKLDHITERLISKKRWFFPSGVSNYQSSDSQNEVREKAILAAVCYAAVFNSGIHIQKLYNVLGLNSIPFSQYYRSLEHMLDYYPDLLHSSGGVVGLTDKMSGWVQQKSISGSREIHLGHRGLIRMILWIPWVRGLYYSGGTVHGSGLEGTKDLDLLVVASGDRAWVAYAAIRLLSRLSRTGDILCTNYILDENAQEVYWQRDYYTAFQLLFLKKIALKPDLQHIRIKNRWVYDYFPNSPRFNNQKPMSGKGSMGLMGLLNLMIMGFWTRNWRKQGKKSGSEGILFDARRIKLHTNDHRPYVSQTFSKLLSKYLQKLSSERAVKLQEHHTCSECRPG